MQVLSKSVAIAMRMTGREEYKSTIELVDKINDIFDTLNVTSRNQGVYSRNKFKEPIESSDDWRFQV